MVQQNVAESTASVAVKNIGGIEETNIEFEPGVTLLAGRNATNRTSFLQAVMAVVGSNHVSLKADADDGRVTLDMGGKKYSRTLKRQDGRITMSGDPYLTDSTLADLFAFLLETNECRQAVARSDDLSEIIMRPVDTNQIESEIRELEGKQDRIDSKLSELDELSNRLPQLEKEYQEIQAQIDKKESQLSSKQDELGEIDRTVEESRKENEELDTKMTELQDDRMKLKQIQRNIESEEESLDALQDELTDQKEAFEELSAVSDDRISNLHQEMQRMRGQVEAIDQTINELQSVIKFNEEFLEEGQPEIAKQLYSDETSNNAVTNELLVEDETLTCWTCGTNVATKQIESNLEDLRSLRQQKVQDRKSIEENIEELQNEKDKLEAEDQRYQNLNRQIDETQEEITNRKETLESLEAQKNDLSSEVTQLEAEVKELQKEDNSEVLAVQEEINHLEFELDELTLKSSNMEDEIESIENKLGERENLEATRSDIQEGLEDLRTHVEQLQEQAINEFNHHMEAVLDLLDYNNLERIWIERSKERVREGRRKVDQYRFKLHIVRSTESGTVYEDTIDHLSESEREVTGLIFALAGYLVHDVYEKVPFMLMDSIEAIDANRIANLVDYLEEYADYLVVALLDEDAAALDDDYPRITPI